jgi:hypothetical protein
VKKPKPEKWYSAKEAAPFLRVNPETVKKYCKNGDFRGKRVGPKNEWFVKGTQILRKQREWALETIDG